MKAEHRHQLQTNALADYAGRLLESMKTTPRGTPLLVWILIIVALATLLAWKLYAGYSQNRRSELWASLDIATHDPVRGLDKLSEVDEQWPGSLPSRTARFDLARIQYANGQELLTSTIDRQQAISQIEKARELYAKLANECSDSPLLAQEALMGVAKAEESLVGVTTPDNPKADLEKAIAAYRRLAAAYPQGIQGTAAKQRADELESRLTEVEKFYAELSVLAGPKTPPEPKAP